MRRKGKTILILLFLSQLLYSQQIIQKFILPLPEQYQKISSKQDLRDAIKIEEFGGSTSGLWHNGFDFPCPEKTKVYATKDGVVTCVYPGFYNGEKFKGHPFYGGLIIIKHYDGTLSLYAHLSCTYVVEGQEINQGETIALSGGVKGKRASGASTGPHLHFGIYIDLNECLKLE